MIQQPVNTVELIKPIFIELQIVKFKHFPNSYRFQKLNGAKDNKDSVYSIQNKHNSVRIFILMSFTG